jgi:hypothetical protein
LREVRLWKVASSAGSGEPERVREGERERGVDGGKEGRVTLGEQVTLGKEEQGWKDVLNELEGCASTVSTTGSQLMSSPAPPTQSLTKNAPARATPPNQTSFELLEDIASSKSASSALTPPQAPALGASSTAQVAAPAVSSAPGARQAGVAPAPPLQSSNAQDRRIKSVSSLGLSRL